MSVSTLASNHSSNRRHLAIPTDDSLLLLLVWTLVRTILGRGEKEVGATTVDRTVVLLPRYSE